MKRLKPVKKYAFYFLLFLFPVTVFVSSCNTFDPPLTVPVYGHIDSIHFTVPADSVQKLGSASANIQYAWVYLDDNPIGAFQLPCTFPMIASNGIHTVEVYPGVTPAGTNAPAGIYPFYQFYSVVINMQQGNTYQIKPTSVYYPWVHFPFMENFNSENVGGYPKSIINYHGGGNANGASTTNMLVINGKLAFQGNSGMVIVNSTNKYYIGMTWLPDSLPTNGSTQVYVELNYRCTAAFSVGLFEDDTATQISPSAIVYPSSKWNKLYLSLNNILPTYFIEPYDVYFSMQWQTGDPINDTLLLDNIKILD